MTNNENKISEETFRLAEIDRKRALGYFDQYWKYASVLRNWFIAYGIGALTLVISRIEYWKEFKGKKEFILCVIIGISLQVFLTFLNKTIHWFVYEGENEGRFKKHWKYKISKKIACQFWIDIVIDLATMVLFGLAAVYVSINLCHIS